MFRANSKGPEGSDASVRLGSLAKWCDGGGGGLLPAGTEVRLVPAEIDFRVLGGGGALSIARRSMADGPGLAKPPG